MLNSLFRSAAGVSGKTPGRPSVWTSFSFSRGTPAARAAVVESGAAEEFMMGAVAGTIRSGVRTLFSFPLSSVSLGAV